MSLTIPLDQPGTHFGHIRLPWSRDTSAWGHLMVPVCVMGTGTGPTALVMGGNHGDEYEGPLAIRRLIANPPVLAGRLIAIPSLNHPAFLNGSRTSPIDGGNLNRAFPGNPSGTVTQKIAAFLNDHLIPLADIVLDFHSGGKTLDFLPMAVCHILDDAEHDGRCFAAATAFGAPYTARLREIDDSGMLDGAAERAGKTFVSTELGGGGTTSPALVQLAEAGLRRFLAHGGLLADTPPPPAPPPAAPTRALDLSDPDGFHFPATGGLFEPLVTLGQSVTAGTPLARIYAPDTLSAPPTQITAQRSGLIAARHVPGLIAPGDCAFVIGTASDAPTP